MRPAAPRPYESHAPFRRPLRVPEETPFLHAARRVRYAPLLKSGLGPLEWLRAQALGLRLRLALARAAGTWRYRVRVVRWLRADVGFCAAAPLRSLTDHRRREVLFDWDAFSGVMDLARHPAVSDEARHIRERTRPHPCHR
jgi:hypothetical protein